MNAKYLCFLHISYMKMTILEQVYLFLSQKWAQVDGFSETQEPSRTYLQVYSDLNYEAGREHTY